MGPRHFPRAGRPLLPACHLPLPVLISLQVPLCLVACWWLLVVTACRSAGFGFSPGGRPQQKLVLLLGAGATNKTAVVAGALMQQPHTTQEHIACSRQPQPHNTTDSHPIQPQNQFQSETTACAAHSPQDTADTCTVATQKQSCKISLAHAQHSTQKPAATSHNSWCPVKAHTGMQTQQRFSACCSLCCCTRHPGSRCHMLLPG